MATTTLEELDVRVSALERRTANQREDIDAIVSDLSKVITTQEHHTRTLDQHTQTLNQHTQTLDQHTQTLNQHSQILDQHTRTLNQHTKMFEALFAHLGIPLPAEVDGAAQTSQKVNA